LPLNIPINIDFLPMSALKGDMIVDRGDSLNWYKGLTLLQLLENLDTSNDIKESSLRLPMPKRPWNCCNKKQIGLSLFRKKVLKAKSNLNLC